MTAEYQSTGESETYTGIGTVPKMTNVTHDVLQVSPLYVFSQTIVNDVWKSAFNVPRAYYEDEKLGQLQPRIQELGLEAARHPGELVFGLVISNPLAFDGVALIADTRVIGTSANIDNQIAGGSDPTVVANFQLQLAAARGTMRKFQDEFGRPLNRPGNVIMVPAELESVAYQALNAQTTYLNQAVVPAGATGFFNASQYTVVVNPYLTDVNDWYLIYSSGASSPFIYQTRISPDFEPLAQGSLPAIVNDEFVFTVRARYNVGVGDPRFIVKITNT